MNKLNGCPQHCVGAVRLIFIVCVYVYMYVRNVFIYLFIYSSGFLKPLLDNCRLGNQGGFEIKKTRMLHS